MQYHSKYDKMYDDALCLGCIVITLRVHYMTFWVHCAQQFAITNRWKEPIRSFHISQFQVNQIINQHWYFNCAAQVCSNSSKFKSTCAQNSNQFLAQIPITTSSHICCSIDFMQTKIHLNKQIHVQIENEFRHFSKKNHLSENKNRIYMLSLAENLCR